MSTVATLLSSTQLNHNVKRYHFKTQSHTLYPFPVAACVRLNFPNLPDLQRPYTPISVEGNDVVFAVKTYPTGGLSQKLWDMKEGDTIEITKPLPKFKYEANMFEVLGLIAGGTGITPMYQVITRVLEDPEDKTKMTLLLAAKNEAEIMLRPELDKMVQDHPEQLRCHYILSSPDDNWKGLKGTIDDMVIKQYIPSQPKAHKHKILVCGTDKMVESIAGAKASKTEQGPLGGHLNSLGFTADQVFKF